MKRLLDDFMILSLLSPSITPLHSLSRMSRDAISRSILSRRILLAYDGKWRVIKIYDLG